MAAHYVARSARTAARDTRPRGGCDDALKDQSRPRPAERLSGIRRQILRSNAQKTGSSWRPSSLTVGAAVGSSGRPLTAWPLPDEGDFS